RKNISAEVVKGENPEDIEFYDEQLQAEKVEALNIRLEVKN
ncbi:hypothetical protein PCS81218_00033, partial [Streptococcus pneumoniae PCS81218]